MYDIKNEILTTHYALKINALQMHFMSSKYKEKKYRNLS